MLTSVEITVDDFLAHSAGPPGLIDLSPRIDWVSAAWPEEGAAFDVAKLAALVRGRAGRGADVRLLVADGQRFAAAAAELATAQQCDVYLTSFGAGLRFVRETSSVTGETCEVVAIDRASGEPVGWSILRPAGTRADLITWFVNVQGRLRPRTGLATLPLPGGVAFATRASFRDTARLAGVVRSPAAPVTVVSVEAGGGRFEISTFEGTESTLAGVEFATLILASQDVVHPDVQLAVTWPTDARICRTLSDELTRLADALGRTVWVPRPAGSAVVLSGCGEFVAVDEVGSPSGWLAYPTLGPDAAAGVEPVARYETDPDGRLVPLGEVAAAAFAGVPFVSVPAAQLDRLRPWYESVAPCDGLFALDLAVLDDGRLGVCRADAAPLAIGPLHLQALLTEAGWAGQDLLLLTQPPQPYWDAAVEHARWLIDGLKVDLWMPAAGATVCVRPDGTLAAEAAGGAELAWQGHRFGSTEVIVGSDCDPALLPPALARAAGPAKTAGVPPPTGPAAPPAGLPNSAQAPAGAADPAPAPAGAADPAAARAGAADPAAALTGPAGGTAPAAQVAPAAAPRTESAVEPVAVLPRATKSGRPHAVPWLPPSPVVNARPADLYIWTPLASEEFDGWGLPAADLFLVAGQDPLQLAEARRDGCLLRVRVPAQAAVDLLEHPQHMPERMRLRLPETGCTHLLPVAWLAGVEVTARYDLDGRGGVAPRVAVDRAALAIRFEGAEHGVPGLPNEVVRWPRRRVRAAPAYLVLPEGPEAVAQLASSGHVSLSRRRPKATSGQRMLEIRIAPGSAIDVPATLTRLAGLPVVGRMHDFFGLDLLLSQRAFSAAAVAKIWRGGERWRPVAGGSEGGTLAAALALAAAGTAAAAAGAVPSR